MMSLWEKNKESILLFWRVKKKSIMMLFCEVLSLSIASYFFIPFLVTDMIQKEFYFAPWYVLAGGVICFGVFGMIYSLFSFEDKINIKSKWKTLYKLIGIILGTRLLLALLSGLLGMVLIGLLGNIDKVKLLTDQIVRVSIAPMNAFILLYFVKLIYNLDWKSIWNHMLVVTIICYIADIAFYLMQFIGQGFLALAFRSVISAFSITGIIVFVFFIISKNKKNKIEEYI